MRPDLEKAHDAAALRGTLEEALKVPLLARCLEITARALALRSTRAVSKSSARISPAEGQMARKVAVKDLKRAGAADFDE